MSLSVFVEVFGDLVEIGFSLRKFWIGIDFLIKEIFD